MEVSRIHEDITQLLYKVEEQYSRIIQFRDGVPLIEVDLALKDIRDLYESFMDLRTATELQRRNGLSNEQQEKETPAAATQNKTEKKVSEPAAIKAAEPVITQIEKPIPEATPVPEKIVSAADVQEVEIKSPSATDTQDVNPDPQRSSESGGGRSNEDERRTVSMPSNAPLNIAPKVDLLKEREKDFVPTVRKIEFRPEPASADAKKESIFEKAASLYDKIAKPGEKTVASQATRQPISNIKSSIGINEKFAYLKDLFKNNINEYNEALDKLNNFESYADAEDYFQDLKSRYNWDPEGKSFQGLADLLNRRYLHNA